MSPLRITLFLFLALSSSFAGHVVLSTSPTYQIDWQITERSTIVVTARLEAAAWMGLGWQPLGSQSEAMPNADYAIAIFSDDGKVQVSDYFLPPDSMNGPPFTDISLGGQDNITVYFGYQVPKSVYGDSGYSVVTFEKALKTSDSKDHDIVPGEMSVIWAHGDQSSLDPNAFGYHYQSCGSIKINWFTGQTVNSDIPMYQRVHGSLMIFAYGVCMSFGAFIARHLKIHYWWFPLHIILQVSGCVTSLVSFGLIVYYTPVHFSRLHTWVGLATLCFATGAPFIGWLSDMLFDPKRQKTSFWPDIFHWWLGRITILLSYVSIILGFFLLDVPELAYIFAICVAFYIFIYFWTDWYKWAFTDLVSGGLHGAPEDPLKINYNSIPIPQTI